MDELAAHNVWEMVAMRILQREHMWVKLVQSSSVKLSWAELSVRQCRMVQVKGEGRYVCYSYLEQRHRGGGRIGGAFERDKACLNQNNKTREKVWLLTFTVYSVALCHERLYNPSSLISLPSLQFSGSSCRLFECTVHYSFSQSGSQLIWINACVLIYH